MAEVNPTISIITLNVNGLNSTIKRQKLSDTIKVGYNHMLSIEDRLESKMQLAFILLNGKYYTTQTATIRKL